MAANMAAKYKNCSRAPSRKGIEMLLVSIPRFLGMLNLMVGVKITLTHEKSKMAAKMANRLQKLP